jgi:hypothetical protein
MAACSRFRKLAHAPIPFERIALIVTKKSRSLV